MIVPDCVFSKLALAVLWIEICHGSEELTKCLQNRQERIRISCPTGHVLYNPRVIAGASVTSDCTRHADDCTGVPRGIERQVAACYWKKHCTLVLRQNNALTCDGPHGPHASNISYVVINKINCVRKDHVYNMCSAKSRRLFIQSDAEAGVIKSHNLYSRKTPRCKDAYNMTIKVSKRSSLVFDVVSSATNSWPTGLRLFSTPRSPEAAPILIPYGGMVKLHGNSTSQLVIEGDFRWKRKLLSGFMLSFIIYKSKELDDFMQWPKAFRPVLKELSEIFEVRAVIEQCASHDGQMSLTCGKGEIIYFPSLAASSHGTNQIPSGSGSCCRFGRYPCGGLSPNLLAQSYQCYWRNTCSVSWRADDRILRSKDNTCIGQPIAVVGTEGHRCVHNDSIYDLCDRSRRVIDAPWGIIRSHDNYPWNFNAKRNCSLAIKIGGRRTLKLLIQDVGYEKNGRRLLSMEHAKRSGTRSLIANPKHVRPGSVYYVSGGTLRLKLHMSKKSRSWSGLVIVFHRFPTSKRTEHSNKDDSVPSTPTFGIVNDAREEPHVQMSNRMLCSGSRKMRQRGRSCAPRVWTDYYTKFK